MLPDVPLFTFEVVTETWGGRVYLCEYCVWWNGLRELMEAVEIMEVSNG